MSKMNCTEDCTVENCEIKAFREMMKMRNNKNEYKMVIAVRKDLEMSKGKFAVQVAHASVMAVRNGQLTGKDEVVNNWIGEGQYKIVVKARNENQLNKLMKECENNNINHSFVRDFGHTEVEPNTFTCIAIGPDKVEVIDAITKKLSLWK